MHKIEKNEQKITATVWLSFPDVKMDWPVVLMDESTLATGEAFGPWRNECACSHSDQYWLVIHQVFNGMMQPFKKSHQSLESHLNFYWTTSLFLRRLLQHFFAFKTKIESMSNWAFSFLLQTFPFLFSVPTPPSSTRHFLRVKDLSTTGDQLRVPTHSSSFCCASTLVCDFFLN